MPIVATAVPLPTEALAVLEEIATVTGPGQWREALSEADGLVSPVSERIDATLLAAAPRLKIVANAGVGFDNVDLSACRNRGIVVTNTPGVLTDATADLAIALMLATVRGLSRAEASLRAGEFRGWGFWDHVHGDVTNATVGIFGMGRIGQAFARRARVFGTTLLYHNRTPLAPGTEHELGATWVDWPTLLANSDILSVHAAYTPELRHVIDADALARMKKGSFLINTARGALIDEAALVDALRDGPLAGAGLDVYEREPIVHPGLLDLTNVVLLPHIGSATPATRTAMALLACRNVAAVLAGNKPISPVPM